MFRVPGGRFPEHGDDEILPDGVKASRHRAYEGVVILFFPGPADTL